MNVDLLREKIAENQLEEVFSEMRSALKGTAHHNKIIQLSGRYQDWKSKTLMGLHDSNLELNLIRAGLLEMLGELGRPAPTGSVSDNRSPLMEKIVQEFQLQSRDVAILFYHLGTSGFEWRKRSTLQQKTGWTAGKLDELAAQHPEYVKRSIRTDGEVIYSLKQGEKEKLSKLLD